MSFDRSPNAGRWLSIILALSLAGLASATDLSSTPLSTYSVTSTSDVKPNVLFVLDDSGSMDWDFMPDWACAAQSTANSSCGSIGQNPSSAKSEYLFRNAVYNGVYYNPTVRYVQPIAVSAAGATNTTTYLSMTGTSTSTGGDSSATSSSPNWNAVKDDAYGVQSSSTTKSNLSVTGSKPPIFYTAIAGEYCDSSSLKTCTTSNVATGAYTFPAPLRWCDSAALTNCQAAFSPSFSYARSPSPRTTSLTVNTVANLGALSSLKVNGNQILSATVTAGSTTTTAQMATNIAAAINACNGTKRLACDVAGFAATVSGSTITITAGPVATLATPVLVTSGTLTFSTPAAFSTSSVPGYSVLTVIVPGTTALYPYPGDTSTTPVKSPGRSDCAGTTCTGNEEMTNYANWWTYYRTRMQMMKTAASNAFSGIDTAADVAAGKSKFRLGYMTINNNTGTDFVNLGEFTGTQKGSWYSKLLSANPGNSTPLRRSLSDAGRLYAGRLNGTSLNGVTVTDPMQYYCQRNYTILSTDGFWNGSAGYKLDGTTPVGNQDAGQPAPYGDGGTTNLQKRTSKLQVSTAPAINQYRNSYLQTRTTTTTTSPAPIANWQRRDSSNGGSTWTSWATDSSCPAAYDNSGSTRVDCRISKATSSDSGLTWTAWTTVVGGASACTTVSTGTSRTQCGGSVTSTTTSAWVNATSTCTVSSTVACQYSMPTNSFTNTSGNAACNAVARSTGSPYTVLTAVECQQVTGTFSAYVDATSTCTTGTYTRCQYTSWSAWGNTSSCTAAAQSTSSPYSQLVATQCQTVTSSGTSDTLADVAAYYYNTDLRTATPATTADTTGTCTSAPSTAYPSGYDLCSNNPGVPAGGTRDEANWQHMTTFTLGLGSQGQMIYSPDALTNDYWNDTAGDFFAVKSRSTAVPSSGICSWQSSGVCYWPIPASNSNANIDDLWHAAINGHGTYFSAKDPTSLSTALTSTLSQIPSAQRDGTSAAAASSNPNVTSSDNYIFSSSYKSVIWTGELTRRTISDTGALSQANWSAARLLDCTMRSWAANTAYIADSAFRYNDGNGNKCYVVNTDYTSGAAFDFGNTGAEGLNTTIVNADETAGTKVPVVPSTTRKIYTNSSTALINFDLATLTTASLNNSFTQSYLTGKLSQFCNSGTGCIGSTNYASASGQTLIDYLTGSPTKEGTWYRTRVNVLGDIVSSEARYVKAPLENYTDTGFSNYKTAQASRTGMVYVGANDGMLHAFDATTGKESWAYIPSQILPNLYKLADLNYSTNHQFYVDGTAEVSEVYGPCRSGICTGSEWHTILVSGLSGGGKSYFALDITDPADPRFLWEVTDSSMGYTYGNPKITKTKDGTWVVMFASGYNNSDGKGYLYIRNALTGASIRTISTATVGEVGRINSRALSPDTDNTSIAAYGGDTVGNLWRFDINGDIGATGYDAQKLVTFYDALGKAQPITAKPDVATVNGLTMVYVGTGKYLGVSDITNTDYQSFYGVVDRSNATTLTTPRGAGTKFVRQTLTDGLCPSTAPSTLCSPTQTVRTSTSNSVDWTANDGWYIDFLGAGERSATDPTLALGTVLFTSISPSLPTTDPCTVLQSSAGGKSFLYALNYLTGGAVSGSVGVVGMSLGNIIATRPVPVELPSGQIVTITQGTAPPGSDVATVTSSPPISSSTGVTVRRVSWRELTSQ